jgi:hypothetical protein
LEWLNRARRRAEAPCMAELGTAENEERVARVYTRALEARSEGRQLSAADLVVYEVEMLSQEVNSGASFEQYFRWAPVAEIARIAARLESLRLPELAALVRRAIEVAFPDGVPASDTAKEARTAWSAEQEERLAELASEFEQWNGRLINVLGAYHREKGGEH